MANITKIKAKDPNKTSEKEKKPAKTKKPATAEIVKKPVGTKKKDEKKTFVLFRPFIAIGHYFRDSWQELRQVRWPNRKLTWQMVLAVFIYAAVLMAIILLLDALFTFLSNIILAK